jgi:hypothetical protein
MTSLETLNIKVVANVLRFLLVTYTVSSDARFDGYGLTGHTGNSADLFWTE